jgi:hypothetical protein
MRSKHQRRPVLESLEDRVVLSHVGRATSLVHIDTSHLHITTLTIKGSYFILPAYGPKNSLRYISFGTPVPTTVVGLGPVELGGTVDTHGPGLALVAHPGSRNSIVIRSFDGAHPANAGLVSMKYVKRVAPVTKGFTFAYKFTISTGRGEFAGAHGRGSVEVKLIPKPPLTANAPATKYYTGKCIVRFHFSPSTVLT